jgi:hypothetical protein
MLNLKNIPPEIESQLLDDDQFKAQVAELDTPGGIPPTRKLLDEVNFGLITPPVVGRLGGRKNKRKWLPWTPSGRDASIRLMYKNIPRAHVAEIVRLSEIIFSGYGDLRALAPHLSEFEGKAEYETWIVYWLRVFVANLRMLYHDTLDGKKLDYFKSDLFQALVMGLTHGFYEVKGNIVRLKRKVPDPDKALSGFAPESKMSMAAKGRE